MSHTALSEIQQAIYDALVPGGTLDATLAGLGVTGVFDLQGIPENQSFDYITIGNALEIPWNTLGLRGYQLTYTIDIWTRQRGTKNVDAMVARINDLLDQQHLMLPTQSHVGTLYDRAQHVLQPDGLTLHVPLRYIIYTQE